jgi:Flp pilus assembly protein TadG
VVYSTADALSHWAVHQPRIATPSARPTEPTAAHATVRAGWRVGVAWRVDTTARGLRDTRRPTDGGHRLRGAGQALVEFSLVLPLFVVLLLAVIEFAMVFSSLLDVNYASRNAALTGAEAGNRLGADCAILDSIAVSINAPANASNITEVDIFDSNAQGQPVNPGTGAVDSSQVNVWLRTGSTACSYNGRSFTVPYTLQSAGYPEPYRCNYLNAAACVPPRYNGTLDTLGVKITYDYKYFTPLGAAIQLLGLGNGMNLSWTFTQTNEIRMEPVL